MFEGQQSKENAGDIPREDFTELMQTEQAVYQNQAIFTAIIENTNTSIWSVDQKYRLLFGNQFFHQECRSGMGREIAVGECVLFDFLSPSEREEWKGYYDRALRGEQYSFERKRIHSDSFKWNEYHMGPIMDQDGKRIGVTCIACDITERMRVVEALRESKQLLERTLASLREAVFIIDADTLLIIDCNLAASEIFGYSRQEILGRTTTFLHADQAALDEFRQFLYPAVEEKGFLFLPEFRMKRKDGTVFPTEHSVIPLEDEQGQRVGWVSVVRDITQSKQTETTLRRQSEEFKALQSTVLEITGVNDLPVLLQTIVERAVNLLGARSGGMYLNNPDRKEVRCVVSYNTPQDYTGTILKYGEGAAGVVAQTREPLIIDDYRVWEKRASTFEGQQPFTTVLSVPMIWQERVSGVIHVLDDVESRRFTKTDQDLLAVFANHAAIAVENTRLVETMQQEIYERKKIEAVIQASEARYRELFNNMHSGVAVYEAHDEGRDFVFVDFNQAGEQIDHVRKPDLVGKRVLEVFPGIKDFGLWDVIRRVWKTGKPEHHPVSLYQDERIVGWRENYIYKLPSGEIVAVYDDLTAQKQAQEGLKESEALWRSLTETSPDHILTLDKDLNIQFANFASPGLTIEALIGTPLYTYVEKDRQAEIKSLLKEVLRSGQDASYETTYVSPEGQVIYNESRVTPRRLPDSEEIIGLTLSARDITERKQFEDNLRESEEKFRSLFMGMVSGAAIHELLLDEAGNPVDYITLDINKSYENIVDKKREEVVGEKASEIIPQAELQDWLAIFGPVALTGKPTRYEMYSPLHQKYFEGSAYPLGEQNYAVTFYDSTQRHLAEQRLSQSEWRYRTLFEQMNEAVFLIDLDGRMIAVNQCACELLGFSQDELVQRSVLDISAEEDQSQEVLRGMLEGKIYPIYERSFRRKDGSLVIAEVNTRLVHDPEGQPLYIQSVVRDITERKRVEEERQNLLEQVIRDANELEKRVQQRTQEYQAIIDLTAGREVRMAGLKEVIATLRAQLIEAGLEPVVDDPLSILRTLENPNEIQK
jgi:PAS domain S-box-containing protein